MTLGTNALRMFPIQQPTTTSDSHVTPDTDTHSGGATIEPAQEPNDCDDQGFQSKEHDTDPSCADAHRPKIIDQKQPTDGPTSTFKVHKDDQCNYSVALDNPPTQHPTTASGGRLDNIHTSNFVAPGFLHQNNDYVQAQYDGGFPAHAVPRGQEYVDFVGHGNVMNAWAWAGDGDNFSLDLTPGYVGGANLFDGSNPEFVYNQTPDFLDGRFLGETFPYNG